MPRFFTGSRRLTFRSSAEVPPKPAGRPVDGLDTPSSQVLYIHNVDLRRLYRMDLPISYVFCTEDRALPDGWWHPMMSSRIKHAYAEIPTCHEVMFSAPEARAETLIRMSR